MLFFSVLVTACSKDKDKDTSKTAPEAAAPAADGAAKVETTDE